MWFRLTIFNILTYDYKTFNIFPFRVFILFLLASFGVLYPYNRGALLTSLVLIYSITSAVAGYTAASFHNQFAEAGWVSDLCFFLFFCLPYLFQLVTPVTQTMLNSRNGVFVLLGFCTWAHYLWQCLFLTQLPSLMGPLLHFHLAPLLWYFLYVCLLVFHCLPWVEWLDTVLGLNFKHLVLQSDIPERSHHYLGIGKHLVKCLLQVFYLLVQLFLSCTTYMQACGATKSSLFLGSYLSPSSSSLY